MKSVMITEFRSVDDDRHPAQSRSKRRQKKKKEQCSRGGVGGMIGMKMRGGIYSPPESPSLRIKGV